MDAEIEKKLDDVGVRLHLRPSQIARFKAEVEAIVVGTIPDVKLLGNLPNGMMLKGFEDCRTEMLSRWTRKESL